MIIFVRSDNVYSKRHAPSGFCSLKNLRLYRLGASRLEFYLMGEAENGDWIGIRTEVTWT
ncbi:MAG: nuclease A inhibitor family protein [Rivularia sp. (in: cyanobacteria)]